MRLFDDCSFMDIFCVSVVSFSWLFFIFFLFLPSSVQTALVPSSFSMMIAPNVGWFVLVECPVPSIHVTSKDQRCHTFEHQITKNIYGRLLRNH